MTRPDVTVLGAGIMGLCVAWACLHWGARVRVIDPAGPGAGASGGLVGALAPHVPEAWNAKKAFQLQALLYAAPFWAEVARFGGQDPGYARLGRLQPLADEAALALARTRADQAGALWGGQAQWQVVRADTAAGWAPTSASGWLVADDLSARIAPRRAIAALVAALRAGGATILRDGAAEGLVVEATGQVGLRARLGPAASATAGGEKGQAALLALDRRDAPQIFADGVHVVPQADGTTAVGSTSERDWAEAGTDGALEDLITRARAVAPLQDAPVIARWAGVRPRWTTRAPLIGAEPGRAGRFVANGGYKIGFAVAPLAGRMLAALMLGGRDDIPADFRPQPMPG